MKKSPTYCTPHLPLPYDGPDPATHAAALKRERNAVAAMAARLNTMECIDPPPWQSLAPWMRFAVLYACVFSYRDEENKKLAELRRRTAAVEAFLQKFRTHQQKRQGLLPAGGDREPVYGNPW